MFLIVESDRRLAIRINADQERVEMQMKKTHSRLAAKKAENETERHAEHTHKSYQTTLINDRGRAGQQQVEQAGRLVAEALQCKQNRIPNPDTGRKTKSSRLSMAVAAAARQRSSTALNTLPTKPDTPESANQMVEIKKNYELSPKESATNSACFKTG